MEHLQFYKLFLTLFSLIFTWYLLKSFFARKQNVPPSPPKLPVIGNLHQIRKPVHRSLCELSKEYGPLMLFHFGSKPALIVSTPEVAREVLKTHDLTFANRTDLPSIKRIFYDQKDLINMKYGEQWRKLRTIFVRELLSNARVSSFYSIRAEEVSLLLNKLRESYLSGSKINFKTTGLSYEIDLISRVAFGMKASESPIGQMLLVKIEEVTELLYNFNIGEFVPWLAWINWLNGHNAELDRHHKEVDKMFGDMVEQHLKRDRKSATSRKNFLDILLDMYKGLIPGVSLDITMVKCMILVVFVAATDTSGLQLEWAMTELIRHPSIMKKLQNEVRSVVKMNQQVSDGDLENMPYLKAVVKESLRLHPPVATYFRSTKEHVNLMGYDIQPQTAAMINIWALNRDPSSWEEPDEFMPERFMNSSMDLRGLDFNFIPFGAGRRICPGLGFAVIALEHMLANIVHKFDWGLPDGARVEDLDITERPGITIAKNDPLIVVATQCYF